MKHVTVLAFAAILLLLTVESSAQQPQVKTKDDKVKVKSDEGKMKMKGEGQMGNLPYTVGYSSNFIIGNPAYTRKVLELWKDWDENMLERHPDYFADTVNMIFADGTNVRGATNALNAAKQYRGSLASVESTIDAVMAVRSVDRNEDWVLVWGTGTETDKNGNKKVIPLHEAWQINKDGKVATVLQYAAAPPKQGQ
ncbi:MAG: hypothetical protein ICV66_00005 [Chitinophagaceae bacterium]|nr:hypothetical protein [Chitinophagaceae bacterium]